MSSAGHAPGSDTGSHLRDLQGHVWCSHPTTLYYTGSRNSGTESLYSLGSLAPDSSSCRHFLQSSHSESNANNIPEYLPGHGGQLFVVVVFGRKSLWIQLPINISVPGVCTLFHILGLCLNYNFWHIAREL